MIVNSGKAIDFKSNIPYYIQLVAIIKENISSGEWKIGQRIPSEPELGDIYGVSRTVVRQALGEIELEGLISRRKGKGTFVAEKKISESLVQKLMGFYQDMVDRGFKPETQVLKHIIQPVTQKIGEFLGIPPETPVFCIERLRFIREEPIVLVTTYIPYSLCPRLADYDLSNQSLYHVLEREFGLKLSHGRRSIEAVPANKRAAQLLQINECDPVLLLNSVTYLRDGTPLEYYHAVHRGDRSRFEVELVRFEENQSLKEKLAEDSISLPSSN